MTDFLAPHHARIVAAILRRHVPGARVRVFGSRARGGATAGSDLDLLVEQASPVSEAALASLDLDFADSDLPFRVDVRDAASLDPAFRRRIEPDLRPLPAGSAGEPVV